MARTPSRISGKSSPSGTDTFIVSVLTASIVVVLFSVMAGLDPAIHLLRLMDARVKPAHDK
jgi:hypothetical protein